jgi:hypothetical protein
LGSWIGRIAVCYSVPAKTLLQHIGIGRTDIRVGNWLTLDGLHASDLLILAQTMRRSTSALTGMLPTPWCLPENAEFGMCAQCIMETFRSGRPMYWRRRWLDAVTVGCLKHVTWLTPLDANIFLKSVNWHGVEQPLLAIAESEEIRTSYRTPPRLTDSLSMSALHLQSIFADNPDDRTTLLRYGIVSAGGARRVAQDLLDVLLAAEAARPTYSLLSELASRLKMPVASHAVSVIARRARATRMRQVKTLEARIFAMAMTDNLMFASARIDELQLRPTAFDARSMRTHWMWPLIPPASLDLLVERIKNWPVDYVKTCWPELDNIENTSILQRRRKLIVRCARRDNPPTLHHRFANIRSN